MSSCTRPRMVNWNRIMDKREQEMDVPYSSYHFLYYYYTQFLSSFAFCTAKRFNYGYGINLVNLNGRWSLAFRIFILAIISVSTANAQVTDNFECRPNGCCDQHEWCSFWSSIGECSSNSIWMTPNCQLACHTCPNRGRTHGSTKPTEHQSPTSVPDQVATSAENGLHHKTRSTDLTTFPPSTTPFIDPEIIAVIQNTTTPAPSLPTTVPDVPEIIPLIQNTTIPPISQPTTTPLQTEPPTTINKTTAHTKPSTSKRTTKKTTTTTTPEITTTEPETTTTTEQTTSEDPTTPVETTTEEPTTPLTTTKKTTTETTEAVNSTTSDITTTEESPTSEESAESPTPTSPTSNQNKTNSTTSKLTTPTGTTEATASTMDAEALQEFFKQFAQSNSTFGNASAPSSPNPPATATAPAPHSANGVKKQTAVKLPAPVRPTGPKLALGNNPARCEEIRKDNASNALLIMIHEGLINEKEDISFKRTFSTSDIFSSNTQFGCAPQQDFTDCSKNICYNLRYRTIDGSCNNFANPLFGASAMPYIRLKPPSYDDGVAAPTGTLKGGRPSARDTSRFLLSSSQMVLNEKFNALMMQFGQFITHDITKTSLLPTDKCIGCTEIPGRCSPIKADQFDPRFGCQNPPCCLPFTRSAPVCGTGTSNPRAQLNENTAFLDGSMIYGSSMPDNTRLRNGALLKSTAFNGHNFLPFNDQQCSGPTSCNANFDAGDNRITIFVGLAAFHTLFLREHNRIASILQQQNKQWNEERVFQETRKIVGAQLQAITYKEWLPRILGNSFDTHIGVYKGYDEKVNPSISSEFTHSAMRFGHGMIQESYNRIDNNGQPIPQGGMKFEEGVLKPQRLLFEGGVDPILRGMMSTQLKKPQRVMTVVTERMFGSSDLAAINLQRGRDVGIPAYNEWREFCNMKRAKTFDQLSGEILDKNVRKNLETGYKLTDAIDLYVGALLEDPVVNGVVGPTIACLIGDQFRRIRDGDRLWFQNPSAFTPEQIEELEKVSLARILCDNADGFQTAPPNAFEVPTGSNGFVPCSNISSLDLTKWAE